MNLSTKPIVNIIFFLMFILLGLIIFSDNGLVELNRLHKEKERIAQRNFQIAKKNRQLYRSIQRLKSDPAYVDYIARMELGMVGTHQIIFKSVGNYRGKPPRKKDE